MVFESSKSEVVGFDYPYREKLECLKECEIRLNEKKEKEKSTPII